ncbi:MAG TPA: sugar ABC transporter ATP-binding protein [Firmicutes bacterium]|nr:sugar ABC transporter ATP-binding protein [Bacillota bacterium]
MSENILELRHISKAFGRNRVLKDVNFAVKKGSVIGLMGENGAGKSTMMKILFGIYSKDDGEIVFDGNKVEFNSPKNALENGVAMVHQELNQCLERNVVDNLFLGRYITHFGVVDERSMLKIARNLFARLDIAIDFNAPMKTMSVSQRQMCEIVKAVSYDAKVIVLDEPTSSLTEREIKKLFKIIEDLKKEGVSFVYISHKMDEIFEICDEVSVLRDGEMIMTKPIKETNMNELISAMVGRSLSQRFPLMDNTPGEVVLEVNKLSTKYEPRLQDISFSVRKGEIFGLYGLVGAGRSELLESLFGVRTIGGGEIKYQGQHVFFHNAEDAMNHHFAFITEERKMNGMFAKCSLAYNTTICNLDKYMRYGVLSNKKIMEATKKEVEIMHTKCTELTDPITSLSGGNQQKIIIGKWLVRNPDVFLMDEPTRGIDVGAKYEIYQLIIKMAKEGKTIIVVSSEMPEILGITNRIAVLSNYRLAGIVNTKETNQEELLTLSAKYL